MASIPFFKLPQLVQSKIIREHVSTVQKAFTMSKMPEFSAMLESKHCWSNRSAEFFEFYDLLRSSLKPGLYFARRGVWSHGFHVSIDEKIGSVSFSLCCVDRFVLSLIRDDARQTFSFEQDFSKTTEFLTTFLDNYVHFDPDSNGVYETRYGYFFIDHSKKTVHWIDGDVHSLRENEGKNEEKCSISDLFGSNHVEMVVRRNKTVRLTCLATLRWEDYHCPCEKTRKKLKPLKFQSFLKREAKRNTAFEFRFRVNENDVSINAECFKLQNCLGFMNLELFVQFQNLKENSKV